MLSFAQCKCQCDRQIATLISGDGAGDIRLCGMSIRLQCLSIEIVTMWGKICTTRDHRQGAENRKQLMDCNRGSERGDRKSKDCQTGTCNVVKVWTETRLNPSSNLYWKYSCAVCLWSWSIKLFPVWRVNLCLSFFRTSVVFFIAYEK